MALIRINQKVLHITIALLIYGVHTERLHCPDVCHCVETSVPYDGIRADPHANGGYPGRAGRTGDGAAGALADVAVDLDETADAAENKSAITAASIRSNDIFVHNFSKSESNGIFRIKNSIKGRSKRTIDKSSPGTVSRATSANGIADERRAKGAGDTPFGEKKEFFTYQITCNEVRDPKSLSLRDLPDPTTQLIIQRASFRSVGAFFRLLLQSSEQLPLLTDLSVTDSEVNATQEDNVTATRAPSSRESSAQKFLPFASLQNPRLRNGNGDPKATEPRSELLSILNLSNNSLRQLPNDAFGRYPNLQTLDLSNNLIEELEDDVFAKLTNLLRLDLHGNRIGSLGELIFKNLTKLLTLDMSKNSISNIAPSTFQYLVSLNTLILSDNPLSMKQQSMMLLGTGKRLQIVDASKTGLKQIPGTLERSVQTLNLQGNYLSSIQCGDLDSYSLLTYLDLGGNKISYVEDDALGRLELLVNLRLSENNLFQIPKSLPNNLEILNLSYNNIQNISNSDFLNLSMLKELYISYNQVSNIEENSFDNLSKLRVLDLSHNPILILPNMYGLVRLATLNLSYFTNIPDRFGNRYEEFPAQAPENIRILNLESSPVLTRTFLQDTKTLQSFTNLEELHLRFSNLTSLRKDIFSLLPKLRVLRVEGNPWHCEKEILRLSEWLESHEIAASDRTEDEEDNEVNAARCATPPGLRRKPLVSLTAKDFPSDGEDASRNRQIGNIVSASAFENQTTLNKKIQEIQSQGEIYFKTFQKSIDYGGDGEIEDLSNASRKIEIDLTVRNNSPSTLLSDNRTVEVPSDAVTETFAECCGNATATAAESDAESTTTDAYPSFRTIREGETVTATETAYGERNSSGSAAPTGRSSDSVAKVRTTDSSYSEATGAEAMFVKGTSPPSSSSSSASSDQIHQNDRPRLILVSFVGAAILAATGVTLLHLAKARKDRCDERRGRDIEVHSISSIGSELW